MKAITQDEKKIVLATLVSDLGRLREDAKSVDCDMLAFLIAQAQDEALGQLDRMEGQ